MGTVNHPHDKLFKETFGDLGVTTDFINNYLPEEILDIIDVGSLTPLKDSYIQEELKDSYSDLLFNVKVANEEGYLYFLFEHKSYQKKDIAFQLLGHMLQIWSQKLTKEKAEQVSIIIPLVFYHGDGKWKNVKTIGNWIHGYQNFPQHIQKYVPDYEFILYDFSIDSDEEIKGDPKLKAFLELSKHIFIKDMEALLVVFITLEQMLSELDESFLDTLIIYLLSARDDVPVETLKDQLTVEGRKRLMSIAEQLERRGEKRGEKRGRMEKARETARKLLLLNMDEEQIIEVTELPREEIEQIKKDLK